MLGLKKLKMIKGKWSLLGQIALRDVSQLAGKILAQQEEDTKLKEDVESLKQMVTQQNFLIQQLLEKLS